MLNISNEQLCKQQFMFSLFFIKRTQGGFFFSWLLIKYEIILEEITRLLSGEFVRVSFTLVYII